AATAAAGPDDGTDDVEDTTGGGWAAYGRLELYSAEKIKHGKPKTWKDPHLESAALDGLGITSSWQEFDLPLTGWSEVGTFNWGAINFFRWFNFAGGTNALEQVYARNARIKPAAATVEDIGSDIKVNDTSIEDLQDVEIHIRLGEHDQEPIPGFEDLHDVTSYTRNDSNKLSQDTADPPTGLVKTTAGD
ncbi:unnamed protein product, partial [marine sediment metagenome]